MSSGLCDGCLGTQRCWVCLGRGMIEFAPARYEHCDSCRATGICPLCTLLPDNGLPDVLVELDPLTRWP